MSSSIRGNVKLASGRVTSIPLKVETHMSFWLYFSVSAHSEMIKEDYVEE